MPSSTFVKNFTDSTIVLSDATGTPLTITVPLMMGDLKISGLKRTMRNTTAYQAQGELTTVRHTDRIFPTITFTAQMACWTSASANSLTDAVLRNGYFASAVSTLGANAEVYTLKATLTVEGTDFGDASDHSAVFNDVEWQIEWSDGDPSIFSLTGTVYGSITGDLAI